MKQQRFLIAITLFALGLSGCNDNITKTSSEINYTDRVIIPEETYENIEEGTTTIGSIPSYQGNPYVVINANIPFFQEQDFTEVFEKYSELDDLGRCGAAFANIGKELMPQEERGSIGMIKPSGWHTVRYDDLIDGKYLYNRCHLIGYQLSGENANEKNLITGTRYLNVEGMLPFENMVADYVRSTGNHVFYRVTPIYKGKNIIADGVLMEARSVEDKGAGIEFNVFVYNVQPGIMIDYATGESHRESEMIEKEDISSEVEIRGNSESKIYHCPGQSYYEEMADSEYLVVFHNEKEALAAGYRKSKR